MFTHYCCGSQALIATIKSVQAAHFCTNRFAFCHSCIGRAISCAAIDLHSTYCHGHCQFNRWTLAPLDIMSAQATYLRRGNKCKYMADNVAFSSLLLAHLHAVLRACAQPVSHLFMMLLGMCTKLNYPAKYIVYTKRNLPKAGLRPQEHVPLHFCVEMYYFRNQQTSNSLTVAWVLSKQAVSVSGGVASCQKLLKRIPSQAAPAMY